MQDLIDEPLECLCSIAEAKGHAQELEQTERSNYCCFRDVLWLNWYLVVGADKVDFGEDVGTVEGNEEILYVRDGISVWNRGMVKRTIIPTWAPVSRFLGYHV